MSYVCKYLAFIKPYFSLFRRHRRLFFNEIPGCVGATQRKKNEKKKKKTHTHPRLESELMPLTRAPQWAQFHAELTRQILTDVGAGGDAGDNGMDGDARHD